MTQPPNQPPQGGFGAPQNQPPYGTPPTPPTPPSGGAGYGYPQQPPTEPAFGAAPQPAPGNPYAQPTQPYGQPGPYGQSGPYGQPGQQGYGYPTQPQYPGAPGGPGGGGGSPFRGKPAAIIGAVVAVLLIAGGVVWAVSGGDDDKKKPVAKGSGTPSAPAPANPGDGSGDGREDPDPQDYNALRQPGEAKILWYKSAPDAPGAGAEAPGMWITDKVAVKAAYKEIRGYTITTGQPAWPTVKLPQGICAAPKQVSDDGKVVVAYKSTSGDSAKCDQLVQVDLATGKKGWTQKLGKGSGLFDSTISITLSISHDTVIVGRSQSGVALSVSDGKKRWEKKKEDDGSCFPNGFSGGTHVIVGLGCAAGQSGEHGRVEELDPATGHVKWTKELPKGWELSRLYSSGGSPVVLYLTNRDEKKWNINVLKRNSGKTRAQIAVDEDFDPDCSLDFLSNDLEGCSGVAADAHNLYLPTKASTGPNEIIALSLATGKESWRVKSPGEKMLPIKVEGSKLIAYMEASYSAGGKVLSISTKGSHSPATLLKNPEATADVENGFYSRQIDWAGGRFYISTTRLTGNDKKQEKLMMAFGK